MFDLILGAIAAVIILASPHPWVGIIGAAVLMVTVPFRCWTGIQQAKVERRKRIRRYGK